jgi:hypothetical protein
MYCCNITIYSVGHLALAGRFLTPTNTAMPMTAPITAIAAVTPPAIAGTITCDFVTADCKVHTYVQLDLPLVILIVSRQLSQKDSHWES